MFPPVYDQLSGDSEIISLVNDRIFHNEAPQNETNPYIVWQVLNGDPINCITDPPNTDRWSLQINCLAKTSSDVQALARAVRAVIELLGIVTSIPIDSRDEDTRLYWIALQFDWFYPRV